MSMFNIFQVAGSALAAQSQRMNVAASNLANADSVVGPDGEPYRARQVVFRVDARGKQTLGGEVGGVAVVGVVQDPSPPRLVGRDRQYDFRFAFVSGQCRSTQYRQESDAENPEHWPINQGRPRIESCLLLFPIPFPWVHRRFRLPPMA